MPSSPRYVSMIAVADAGVSMLKSVEPPLASFKTILPADPAQIA